MNQIQYIYILFYAYNLFCKFAVNNNNRVKIDLNHKIKIQMHIFTLK